MATRTEKQAAVPVPADEPAPSAVEGAIAIAAAALMPVPPREEALRLLAYSYYEERGRADGHAMDDWLRAEAALGAADGER